MATGASPTFLNRAAAERWFDPKASRRSVFLLAGSDLIALRELKRKLIRNFGGEDPLGLSRTEVDAGDLSPGEMMDLLAELPLFASCRVIVVRSAEELADEKKFPGALATIEKLDELTLLILLMDGSAKELARLDLAQRCLAMKTAAYCYAPRDDREAETWVREFGARNGFKMDLDAAKSIVQLVGNDPVELAPEIEKVAFATDGKINVASVRENLVYHREHPVFDWAEAVMSGNPRALRLAAPATDYGKEGVGAIAALASRIQDLDRLERGENLGYFPRIAAEKSVRLWSAERRKNAREILLDLDLALKSTAQELHLARIEMATLKMMEA
ncbi:MAG: hypothetical protein AAB229_10180 [Candidatus Hydrogenedentota bacterium]